MIKKSKNICHKLGRCGKKNRILAGLLMCISMMFTTCTAFAADGLSSGDLVDPMNDVLNFVSTISLWIGVVGLGCCAFSFFFANEKGLEVAKKRMLHIGLALAGIAMVPLIVNFVYNTTFKSMAWKPEGNNMQIIQEKQSDFVMPTFAPQNTSPENEDNEDNGN